MDLLGRQKLPQVELNEDELNALSGLGKVDTKRGLSFNPYEKIDPEFLKLKDDDDDEWLYISEEQKPRERSQHIFNMVGGAGLVGGGIGVLRGMRMLHRKQFLNFATLRHPIKRSEIITNIVNNVRDSSCKCSTFAFVMSISWAFLDKMNPFPQLGPIEPKTGAAIGGMMYGMSPFWHKDRARTLPALKIREKEWLKEYGRQPRIWQLNNWMESKILNRYREAPKIPSLVNYGTGFGRIGILAVTAYSITHAMDWAGKQKGILRDIKRWKW